MWPLMAIYKIVTSYTGNNAQDHVVAALEMNWMDIVREAVLGTSCAYRPIMGANSQ